MPVINPNDEYVYLAEWMKEDNEELKKGDIICMVETSKAVAEVEAEENGFLLPIVEEDEEIKVGKSIAVIKNSPDEDIADLLKEIEKEQKDLTKTGETKARGWTKKAEIIAKKHGVKIEDVPADGQIKEGDVRSFLEEGKIRRPKAGKKFSEQAILLLGGGGHAKMCIDVLRQMKTYEIAGIIDSKIDLGRKVLNVPVIGRDKDLSRYRDQGIKHAVNAVGAVTNHPVRKKLFDKLKNAGFDLPPLIHPSAVVEPSASLGEGTQVMVGAIVGSSASIGKNCIINSGATVSHDCVIRDHVHISPGAVLAGTVTVDSNSLIGMGVTVYINLDVGKNVTILNGQDIFRNIADGERIG